MIPIDCINPQQRLPLARDLFRGERRVSRFPGVRSAAPVKGSDRRARGAVRLGDPFHLVPAAQSTPPHTEGERLEDAPVGQTAVSAGIIYPDQVFVGPHFHIHIHTIDIHRRFSINN